MGLVHQYSSISEMNSHSCGVVSQMVMGGEEMGLEQWRAATMVKVDVKIGMIPRRSQTGVSAQQNCECHERSPGESVVAQMSTMRHCHLF
jgi:hypothetical protein